MANLIKLKRTNTASAVPSLIYGELGWNSADSKLFVGSFANTAVQLGSVTTLSIVTANGVSGSVATATTTPAITVTLGAITPSSVSTGVVTHSAGTALLPSITTSGDTNTGIYFPAADTVGVSTGGVERVRVDTAGFVGVGTASPTSLLHVGGSSLLVTGSGDVTTGLGLLSVTGGQIVFPATANVSTGANTLDDYEEGTFTPTFTASTTNPTVTYQASTYGRYTKIGRTVFVDIRVNLATMSSAGSGNIRIAGLPFTSFRFSQWSVGFFGNWTTAGPEVAYVEASNTYVNLATNSGGGVTQLSQANLAATCDVMVSGFYTTTS